MAGTFIQLKRNKETEELMKDPACFMLLAQIAYRARRTDEFNVLSLEPGEALIGDYRNIGLSEQKYRTAKNKLEKWNFATFRATYKGTIAKLLDTRIFDINIQITNGQDNELITSQQRTDNEQATTNNKDKNNNNDLEEKFNQFYALYPRKEGKGEAKKKFISLLKKDLTLFPKIMRGIEVYKQKIDLNKTEKQFIKLPGTWLNKSCWEDKPEKKEPEGITELDLINQQLKAERVK